MATMKDAAPALAAPVKLATKKWYVGLTKECPLDFITIPTLGGEGAITFQKFTERLKDDGKGILSLGSRSPGTFVDLFDDEVEKIREYVADHGILWLSRKAQEIRVDIVRLNETQKRSRRDDLAGSVDPLSRFVFMKPAGSINAADRDGDVVPSTIEQDQQATAGAAK
jgi:hypothetical protein